ncbi:hypothetical protein R1flu_009004 [Riccia fluitans]|uniref:Secreted protein n=1 Tax=Riccia fluitans TaxID=41844 RepID=A0ABD1Z502_9MARC
MLIKLLAHGGCTSFWSAQGLRIRSTCWSWMNRTLVCLDRFLGPPICDTLLVSVFCPRLSEKEVTADKSV